MGRNKEEDKNTAFGITYALAIISALSLKVL